jgi:Ca-activated chloride channel family protein
MSPSAVAPQAPWESKAAYQKRQFNTSTFDHIVENKFLSAIKKPLSTFSADVDTASYSVVRSHLDRGSLPPKGAVRVEEMINYFQYDYLSPVDSRPFAVNIDMAQAPWAKKHKIVRIGIKGKVIPKSERPDSNLVFLLDVSGSMESPNKLPLLRKSFKMLVNNLGENDRVAIVVYAGASGLVLDSTNDKTKILDALDQLSAGGSTNGADGIELAYQVAQKNFIKHGTNRVILATDGDFNIGATSQSDLIDLIEAKAKKNVFLTVLGMGMGNFKDSTLEKLADRGNGNYGYIDNLQEARKIFVEQVGGTLVTIAKDVKFQVEFNPNKVAAYRLIGYENRQLNDEDFNDDQKDAGEIGAGHTVTAMYEIIPKGAPTPKVGSIDPLKYQKPSKLAKNNSSNELLTVKIRYKNPDESKSQLMGFPVKDTNGSIAEASLDFKFALAVAGFGMQLRESQYIGTYNFDDTIKLAQAGRGNDSNGYRMEFINLVKMAQALGPKK